MGLHFLKHEMGFNHRDMKPGNLIWVNNVLKVADMGSARLGIVKTASPGEFSINLSKLKKSDVVGILYYMSPEIRSKYDSGSDTIIGYNWECSDVFALGVIMF